MNDAGKAIADRFDAIIRRCDSEGRPSGLPYAEQVIYYVVAVRAEMDINGFASVFEQLLTEASLDTFVRALIGLEEPMLASCFEQAAERLRAAGYWESGCYRLAECSEALDNAIEAIENRVRDGERLWQLDSKLLVLATTAPN